MSCTAQDGTPDELARLREASSKIEPLHRRLGPPRSGDWLAEHPEPGQTFEAYRASRPVLPRGKRKVICVKPIGDFTPSQERIVELAAKFLSLYFNRDVRVMDRLPLDVIPAHAHRVHPNWGDSQILSTHVLDSVLRPRLPSDAACLMAFTPSDLWPGEGWNFVFGQASLRERVGVWSLYRMGNPDESEEAFRLALLRTLKVATHETGHMFSILHCTAYECNMCGSNHREESDRRPLALCPECVAKVVWGTEDDLEERYRRLAAFCKEVGLTEEAAFYEKSVAALAE